MLIIEIEVITQQDDPLETVPSTECSNIRPKFVKFFSAFFP